MNSYINIALELFKLLTPFIIASIVYLIWHKQKEKEVIATEAKNTIALLNTMSSMTDELLQLIHATIDTYPTREIHKNFKDKIDELDKKRLEIFYSALFICDAKEDIPLERIFAQLDYEFKSTLSKLRIFSQELTMGVDVNKSKPLADKYYHALIVNNYAYKRILLEFALYRK
ncbi:hypothetical protein [Acinetobacter pittii]|uniref:hypothetical protein n=1 Tax=Acinetobacter pittii TaxID=48296 RepID=UPI00070E88F6|nr:hypothetical protein [Acinetobacter pittii]KRI52042.1 hypothetical protein APC53_06160 [Acinetobacter pittii]